MDIVQAIILGIVEGITEYLPISSTGHLILTQSLMGLQGEADNAYAIVIQGGAILAVLGLYRKRVAWMLRGLTGKNPVGLKMALNLFVAFLPAAIFGVMLDDMIEAFLFKPVPVIAALALGGVLMLFVSPWQKKTYESGERSYTDIESLSWKQALIIGFLQCIAMWPGTSRSMMTIVGGMAVGLRPKHAAEFSFLLGLPTLGGATVYKLFKSSEALQTMDTTAAIIGLISAFIAAALAIQWLVSYLTKHGLTLFGWYRLGLAAVVGYGLFSGMITL
ncbi:MAG: undecaprenyl-diphosphate phosphatase [Phycisphaerales bacterium]|nr:undecaprenyl-diphosphate phosphatase [Phycisphaerales bacterium]